MRAVEGANPLGQLLNRDALDNVDIPLKSVNGLRVLLELITAAGYEEQAPFLDKLSSSTRPARTPASLATIRL